jgi:hypothetical protein
MFGRRSAKPGIRMFENLWENLYLHQTTAVPNWAVWVVIVREILLFLHATQ